MTSTRVTNGGRAGVGQVTMAVLFTVASLICIAFGWWRMYSYDELSDKVVGGDAYNFQILVGRGTGIIAAGVGLGVIAVVFAVLAVAEKLDAR